MKTTITIFILLISIIFACNPKTKTTENKVAIKQDTAVEAMELLYGWTGGDTSITFNLNSKKITVLAKKRKDLASSIINFQKFLDNFGDKKPEWTNEYNADLNGDGKKNEKVRTTINVDKDSCFVWKEVINKEGEIFWSYRHFFDNMNDLWFFGTKDAFEKLKPYSLFYLGYQSRQFDTVNLNDFLRDAFSKKIYSIVHFKNPHDFTDYEDCENYFKNFNGQCLESYEVTYKEHLIYIFYKPYNQFIAIDPKDYAPKEL